MIEHIGSYKEINTMETNLPIFAFLMVKLSGKFVFCVPLKFPLFLAISNEIQNLKSNIYLKGEISSLIRQM